MFFAGDGSAHVVWNRQTGDRGIMYRVRDASGTWGTPSWITSCLDYYDMTPNVTVSSTGLVYVVWMDGRKDPYQIWGRLFEPGDFSGLTTNPAVFPRELTLDVSPNPASSRMVVSYSLPAAANVSLKLYDISGALAKTVACGYVLPGSYTASLARQGLARGAYILKLESGNYNLTRKLVIE
jgi:hypothetical protein